MAVEYWKNLPDTSTPLNADNLNGMFATKTLGDYAGKSWTEIDEIGTYSISESITVTGLPANAEKYGILIIFKRAVTSATTKSAIFIDSNARMFVNMLWNNSEKGWRRLDNNITYSTGEAKTGDVWINGKPIYRKTISFGALPNNTEKSSNHNISNIDNIIEIKGTTSNAEGNTLTLPMVSFTTSSNIFIKANKSVVTIQTGTDRTSYNKTYVTLYYTKTTD